VFLKEISIIETSPCLAEKHLFKARTKASATLTEILPYLNAILERPNYQPNSKSLMFRKGIIGFILQDTSINITRFANMTEFHETLDWIKDLINDTYEKRTDIAPSYTAGKTLHPLTLYKLLPKTNCKECGEPTCMAFAAKLSKYDAKIDDCPLLSKSEFSDFRQLLESEMI
jgi:ArsR family metal-binding transcriptional regulator